MTKLEREWAARLKETGFHDLEGADRDGPLSNAGKPHAKYETADGHARLAHHLADGTEYQQAARDLLWTDKRRSLDRRIWAMHVDGSGLREITATLDVSWARASAVVNRQQKRMVQSNKITQEAECSRQALRRLVRRAEPKVLEKLARLLAQTLTLS